MTKLFPVELTFPFRIAYFELPAMVSVTVNVFPVKENVNNNEKLDPYPCAMPFHVLLVKDDDVGVAACGVTVSGVGVAACVLAAMFDDVVAFVCWLEFPLCQKSKPVPIAIIIIIKRAKIIRPRERHFIPLPPHCS